MSYYNSSIASPFSTNIRPLFIAARTCRVDLTIKLRTPVAGEVLISRLWRALVGRIPTSLPSAVHARSLWLDASNGSSLDVRGAGDLAVLKNSVYGVVWTVFVS